MIIVERERERERESRKNNRPEVLRDWKGQRAKSKRWLWIIGGIITLTGIGTIIYFTTANSKSTSTETKTPQSKEAKVQQFQRQLSQIQQSLQNLNQNITQTESSLQTKRSEQTQTPSNSLQTEITNLEQQLTTYKTQKQKLETILPKLESQISNLGKANNSEAEQAKLIQQLESEIKEINEELGIKEEPEEKKPNFPNSTYQDLLDDLINIHDELTKGIKNLESNPTHGHGRDKWQISLDKNKTDLQEIKQLQNDLLGLSLNQQEIAEKRAYLRKKWNYFFKDNPLPNEDGKNNPNPNKDKPNREENPNLAEFQTLRENTKNLITKLEKMTEWMEKHLSGELKLYTYASQITSYLDTIKKNKKILEDYSSDKDYNTFVKSSSEAQKINISLVQDAIKNTLNSVKECFDESLFCKIPADFAFDKVSNEELSKIYSFVKDSRIQLNSLSNQDISSQISTVNQIIQKYDEIYKKVY